MHYLIKTANRADINGNYVLADMADSMIKVYAQEDVNDVYYNLDKFMEDFGFKFRDSIALQSAAYLMNLHNNHIIDQREHQRAEERHQEKLDRIKQDHNEWVSSREVDMGPTPIEDFEF